MSTDQDCQPFVRNFQIEIPQHRLDDRGILLNRVRNFFLFFEIFWKFFWIFFSVFCLQILRLFFFSFFYLFQQKVIGKNFASRSLVAWRPVLSVTTGNYCQLDTNCQRSHFQLCKFQFIPKRRLDRILYDKFIDHRQLQLMHLRGNRLKFRVVKWWLV